MIASGKSTYARKRAVEGAIIINDDAIVNAVHPNYLLYDKKLKPLYKSVENTILQMAIALGRDVIIDRPNYSKATRRRYIGIAKSLDATVHMIVFPKASPKEHARRRTASDSRLHSFEYWLKVARHHNSLYEPPIHSEGADCIIMSTETGDEAE